MCSLWDQSCNPSLRFGYDGHRCFVADWFGQRWPLQRECESVVHATVPQRPATACVTTPTEKQTRERRLQRRCNPPPPAARRRPPRHRTATIRSGSVRVARQPRRVPSTPAARSPITRRCSYHRRQRQGVPDGTSLAQETGGFRTIDVSRLAGTQVFQDRPRKLRKPSSRSFWRVDRPGHYDAE